MIVTHIAGPEGPDHIQRCSRCGVALKDGRSASELGCAPDEVDARLIAPGLAPYPVGAEIDRAPGGRWQAMRLSHGAPERLCHPSLVPVQEWLSVFTEPEVRR